MKKYMRIIVLSIILAVLATSRFIPVNRVSAEESDKMITIKATLQVTDMKIGSMTMRLDSAGDNFIILNGNNEKLISINLESGEMIVWGGNLTINAGTIQQLQEGE